MSSTSELSFPGRAEIHHTHRDVTGGWLRPTVFGAMDGLVSNFALITGVAAGSHSDTGGDRARGDRGPRRGRVLDGGG